MQTQLLGIAALSLLLATVLHLLLPADNAELRYRNNYGALIADQLARLAQDAVATEDSIALNVLAERIASDEAISRVTIRSMEGRTLADYGNPQPSRTANTGDTTDEAREFTRPIQLAEATAGFVQVTVAAGALTRNSTPVFSRSTWRTLAILILSMLGSWLLCIMLTREATQPPETAASNSKTSSAPEDCVLLVINLFNGQTMQPSRRDALLDASARHVAAVAELYNADWLALDATSIGMVFRLKPAAAESGDRTFQATCAALVLAQLCNQPGGGRYRYSLQNLTMAGEPEAEALADARLHCALADDHTVALAEAFARSMERPERLDLTLEHSPVLANLQAGSATGYYLMREASPPVQQLLDAQVRALRDRAAD